MMVEGFLIACRVLGMRVVDMNGHRVPVSHFRDDPAELDDCRADIEHILKANDCVSRLVQALHKALAYACSLDGETVPVLVPRENVALLAGPEQAGTTAEAVLGRAMAKVIQTQVIKQSDSRDDRLIEQIEALISQGGFAGVPASTEYLTSEQVARRLNLAPKTVRKLFNQKQLIGRKLKSGEWRTTEDDLSRSPYLLGQKRRSHATVE